MHNHHIVYDTLYYRMVETITHCYCQSRLVQKYHSPHEPVGLFSFFFDDNLVGLIVDETNRYAQQSLQGTDKVWETDGDEIRAYMGFMILMGINKLPEIRDYWSVDPKLRYAPIADRITTRQV